MRLKDLSPQILKAFYHTASNQIKIQFKYIYELNVFFNFFEIFNRKTS